MSASCDGARQCCSLRRGDDATPQLLDRLWGAPDRHTARFAGALPVPHPPQHAVGGPLTMTLGVKPPSR